MKKMYAACNVTTRNWSMRYTTWGNSSCTWRNTPDEKILNSSAYRRGPNPPWKKDQSSEIDQTHEKIEFQRVHRLGKPNSFKPCPIIPRFLQYSDRERVIHNARKHLKGHQDFHVFEDIPKDLYELRKQQMKKLKDAKRERTQGVLQQSKPGQTFCPRQICCSRTALAVTSTECIYPFANYWISFILPFFKMVATITKELE